MVIVRKGKKNEPSIVIEDKLTLKSLGDKIRLLEIDMASERLTSKRKFNALSLWFTIVLVLVVIVFLASLYMSYLIDVNTLALIARIAENITGVVE